MARRTRAGIVETQLRLDGEQFARGMKKAEGEVEGFSASVGGLSGGLAKFGPSLAAAGAAAAGAVAGIAKLAQQLEEAAENAALLLQRAQGVGLAVDEFQALTTVFSQFGLEADDVNDAFNEINVKLKDADAGLSSAKDAFEALNIPIRDAAGDLRRNVDVWEDLIAAVQKGGDAETTNALDAILGGDLARRIIPLLQKGTAEYEALVAAAASAVTPTETLQRLAAQHAENVQAAAERQAEWNMLAADLEPIIDAWNDSLGAAVSLLRDSIEPFIRFYDWAKRTEAQLEADLDQLFGIKRVMVEIGNIRPSVQFAFRDEFDQFASIEDARARFMAWQESATEAVEAPLPPLREMNQLLSDQEVILQAVDAATQQANARRVAGLLEFNEALNTSNVEMDKLAMHDVLIRTPLSATYDFDPESLEYVIEAAGRMEEAWSNVGDEISGVFESIATATDRWAAILENVLQLAIRIGTHLLGGGSFASFFGFDDIPGRQFGGPVSAGRPYLVGERGPELFVPGGSGNVVSNRQLGASDPANVTVVYQAPITPDQEVQFRNLLRRALLEPDIREIINPAEALVGG